MGEPVLLDPSLPLEPPHVNGNLGDIVRGDTLDLRHIAEFPVVGADAPARCKLERGISVMTRFVNLVHERRTLRRADRPLAMAAGTIGVELGLPLLEFGWGLQGFASRSS